LSEAKSVLIEQFRAHIKDTGSPEVQIALLSARIPARIDHDGQQAPTPAGLS
jgi:ribosomal protein S15P/S13E